MTTSPDVCATSGIVFISSQYSNKEQTNGKTTN